VLCDTVAAIGAAEEDPVLRSSDMLDTLNNLTPVLLIGGLLFFMTLETWRPYFQHGPGRKRQRWHNVGMVGVAAVANLSLGAVVVIPGVWSEANDFGVLHRLLGQSTLAVVLGIFLIDLTLYALHVSMHKVPTFWRFHRVHHADYEMDSSSGLRQHPCEALYVALVLAIVVPALGISRASSIIYTTIALPWFLLNHSNMKYPSWFERGFSLLMSTPNWHRVHHSAYQPETDSRYGCVFSVWDRLFGTTRKTQVETIRFGLDEYRARIDQTVGSLLKMPFGEL
jgi:sterol desaturase/sphingolipid hydroxylase (fatty acid hydroxylase superfamily)